MKAMIVLSCHEWLRNAILGDENFDIVVKKENFQYMNIF